LVGLILKNRLELNLAIRGL